MPVSNIKFGKRKDSFAHSYQNSPDTMYLDVAKGSPFYKRTQTGRRFAGSQEDTKARVIAQLTTHEQAHDSVYKVAGARASIAIDAPYVIDAIDKSVQRCSHCGDKAQHMHGRHGCCGTARCHMIIGSSHLVPGEAGLTKGLLLPDFEW